MQSESQIPTASQGASTRFATRVALFYGTLFGMTGTHLPFFTVWLKAVGIDAFWIGLITAVPPVTRFTVLPLVTGLAERRQALRGGIIVTAFATALGFFILGTQHLPVLVFLIYALTCCLWTPMVPLTDAYALRGVKRYGLNYGPLRLWGSAAFVLGALVCGVLFDLIAARHLIWIIAGSAAIWRCDNMFSAATPRWTVNSGMVCDQNGNCDSISAVVFAPSDNTANTYAAGFQHGGLFVTARVEEGGRLVWEETQVY